MVELSSYSKRLITASSQYPGVVVSIRRSFTRPNFRPFESRRPLRANFSLKGPRDCLQIEYRRVFTIMLLRQMFRKIPRCSLPPWIRPNRCTICNGTILWRCSRSLSVSVILDPWQTRPTSFEATEWLVGMDVHYCSSARLLIPCPGLSKHAEWALTILLGLSGSNLKA